MAVMTGGEALVKSLAREGVEMVFGLPGVQIMSALDAFYAEKGIRWLSVRHEQTTAYMAFGYARTTGKIGVAMVVPGPGALNATAAVGTAFAASTPVLLLSGQIESYNLGKQHGALHEMLNQSEVFRNITKSSRCVTDTSEIPGAVREAMHNLKTGRPRPVELEMTWDSLDKQGEVELLESEQISAPQPDPKQIQAAAQMLASARRPVIIAGGGAINADASGELTRLAEQLNAPVITTPEGKGAISDEHSLSLGAAYYFFGPGQWALPQADVVLAVGTRLYVVVPSVLSFTQNQKIIQIDVDEEEIGRNAAVHLGITSDARVALKALLEELPGRGKSTWQAKEMAEIKKKAIDEIEEAAPLQVSVLRTIRKELKDDDILVPGITNTGYWSYLAYPVLQPRTYLTSSYSGNLGYGFPTALGAKAGNPQKQVVVLTGDGGFMYALPELATAVQEKLNVVVLLFVDGAFGASLHDQQNRFKGRVIGTRFHNPDFARMAETFGARGIKLSGPDELGEALRSALSEEKPAVIEIPVPTLPAPFGVKSKPSVSRAAD